MALVLTGLSIVALYMVEPLEPGRRCVSDARAARRRARAARSQARAADRGRASARRRGSRALFGPSGAGKTHGAARDRRPDPPDAGRVALGERRAGSTRAQASTCRSPSAACRVGVPVARAVSAHERARQRGLWLPRRCRAPSASARAGVLERMRVAHLAERRPRTFSGGEAQRVALARALASEPRRCCSTSRSRRSTTRCASSSAASCRSCCASDRSRRCS